MQEHQSHSSSSSGTATTLLEMRSGRIWGEEFSSGTK